MEYVKLGNTGISISRVGFGCAPMGGYDYGPVSDTDSRDAVTRALALGINFFDTADVYGFGHAETILGEALGNNRHEAVIATKFGLAWDDQGRVVVDGSPKRVRRALTDSLRRLKVECIPLYQIHWLDMKVDLQDTFGELLRCQEEGKIRYIGCSNVKYDMLNRLGEAGRIESIQNSYNLLNQKQGADIMAFCKTNGVSFIVHSPLARGLLTGRYKPGQLFEGTDTRKKSSYFSPKHGTEKTELLSMIEKLGVQYQKTNSQIALRWILDHSLVAGVIVGTINALQIEENAGATHWTLDPEDYGRLLGFSKIFAQEEMY